jgi:hypothetical protein
VRLLAALGALNFSALAPMFGGRKHLFAVGPEFAFGNDGGAVSGLAQDSSRSLLLAFCSIKEGRQCRRTSAL